MVMHITSSTVNEVGTQEMIRGHKATLTMAGNHGSTQARTAVHRRDRSRERAKRCRRRVSRRTTRTGSIASAPAKRQTRTSTWPSRVQTVISLGEMSDRLQIVCLFDENTRKISTGDGKDAREIQPITYGTLELS